MMLRKQNPNQPAQTRSGSRRRAADGGYGLMLLIMFITSTVLVGTSLQMILGSGTAGYLGSYSQDNTASLQLAQSGMETVLADIQSTLNSNTAVTTSYTYASTPITMPNDPASLGGGTSQIGTFTATMTAARGNSYLVKVTATVGNATSSYSRFVTMANNKGSGVLDSITNANAAYGLRLLRSAYSGSAIRVRRSSDDTEQDIGFDANGNLDMDSLRTFLSVSSPPLTSPKVAFGLRQLRSSYTTNKLIRVRRSSDNTEMDIGFTSTGDLDVKTLMEFVGWYTGYVKTWYDQSGNGTDATQTTAANQPTIVTSGVLNQVGNRPAVRFDGSNDYMTFTRTISDDFTIMVVYNAIAGVNAYSGNPYWNQHAGLVDGEVSGVLNDFGLSVDSSGYAYAGVGNPDTTIVSQTTSNSAATPGLNDGRNHWAAMWRNKTSGNYGLYEDRLSNFGPDNISNINTNSLTAPTNLTIGCIQTGINFLNGYISEIAIYNSKLSDSSMRTIERNQAWYFNMPLHMWTGWYLPLDTVGSSPAAYGLRLLRSAYGTSGPLIKVRRTSDGTTLDIASEPSGCNLDVKALMAFVGSSSGYIQTWYDQSGNGRNISQGTAANQPRIVNAGVLDMQNGKPSIYFPLGSWLETAFFSGYPSAHDVFAIAKVNADYGTSNALVAKTNSNIPAPFDFYSTKNGTGDGTGFALQTLGTTYNSSQPLSLWDYDAGTASMHAYFNGLNTATTTTTFTHADSGGPLYIGTRWDTSTKLDGYVSEVITYASQLSAANRQWLEQNIQQYYAAPLPAAFITKWYDQSGNGYDAVQASPVLQPTLVMPMYGSASNRPTINFSGAQYLYTTGGMPTSADYSIASVFSYFSTADSNNIISDTSNGHAFWMATGGNTLKLWHNGTTFATAGASYTMTTNTNYAAAGTYVQSSKLGTVYVFNQAAGTGTAGASNTSSGIQLGSHNGYNNLLRGTISEALIFSRTLSAADRTAIYNAERGYFGAQ